LDLFICVHSRLFAASFLFSGNELGREWTQMNANKDNGHDEFSLLLFRIPAAGGYQSPSRGSDNPD
jgi:hypothetical protein